MSFTLGHNPQISDEELQKEYSTTINSFVNFTVTDKSGGFIEGIKTNFNFSPPSGVSVKVNFDLRAQTDSSGKTTTQLHKQDLDDYIIGVDLTWSKPFKAIISAPNGNEYDISAEKLINGDYNAKLNMFTQKGFRFAISDNQTYDFNVVLEELPTE